MSPFDDLEIARAEALGTLLGVVDGVILAVDHPTVFDMVQMIDRLRDAKKKYQEASAAYLDARLAS